MPIVFCDEQPSDDHNTNDKKIIILENKILTEASPLLSIPKPKLLQIPDTSIKDQEQILEFQKEQSKENLYEEKEESNENLDDEIRIDTKCQQNIKQSELKETQKEYYINTEKKTNADICEKSSVIDDFLIKLRTPERSGKRQTERISYVLTSSAYKTQLEEKDKIKEEKEKKKEENKQKRLEKQQLKKDKEPKEKIRKKKATLKKKPDKKNSDPPYLDKSVTLNKDSDLNAESNYVPCKSFDTMMKDDNISKNSFSLRTNPTHIKNLFQHSPERPLTNFLPENNTVVPRGLCYICTNNIYRTNIGISCQNCTRTYHVCCLRKYNIYKEHFTCKTCIE